MVRKTRTSFSALEHENRSFKVTSCLVGITQNPKAIARYSLTAPERQRISDETTKMADVAEKRADCKHSDDNKKVIIIEETAIQK